MSALWLKALDATFGICANIPPAQRMLNDLCAFVDTSDVGSFVRRPSLIRDGDVLIGRCLFVRSGSVSNIQTIAGPVVIVGWLFVCMFVSFVVCFVCFFFFLVPPPPCFFGPKGGWLGRFFFFFFFY